MSERTELPLTEKPVSHTHSGCGCGEVDHGLPELDARVIPHAIRHGAIIGAFQQVRPGAAMVLVAPHDPKPLLAQLDGLFGEDIEISYLVQGPDAWKLKFARRG